MSYAGVVPLGLANRTGAKGVCWALRCLSSDSSISRARWSRAAVALARRSARMAFLSRRLLGVHLPKMAEHKQASQASTMKSKLTAMRTECFSANRKTFASKPC
jgi:hypothetical protein